MVDKIDINVIEGLDENGEPIVVSKTYYYKFSYNSITSFRKEEGLTFEKFAEVFSGLSDEDTDPEKKALANEYIGKLFYHALKEGMRKVKQPFDLSVEDVHDYLNDPDNADGTASVMSTYTNSMFKADPDDKKKHQENRQ